MKYPLKIRMLRTNAFGRLSRLPLSSDKGQLYERVDPPTDALVRLINSMKKLGLWDHERQCPVGCVDPTKWSGQ